MKKKYRNILVLYLLTATFITAGLLSCSKEDAHISNNKRFKAITAIIKSADTKTLHQYAGSALKTSWKEGDQIVVFDYTANGKELFKFTQTGMVYNSGKTSAFIPEDPEGFFNRFYSSYSPKAIYPYSDNLQYDISIQTGRVEDLNKYDIWVATPYNYYSVENMVFEFEPMCVILRIPKGSPITSADYSGDITLSFSGASVLNVYDYNDDSFLHGSITIETKVNKGAVEEDTFIAFLKTDDYYYTFIEQKDLYYLDSDRGDHYEFYRTNIGTEKIYTLDTKNSGYVHFEDIEFKAKLLIDLGININGDNEISYAEAKNATRIAISASTISSFVGLEYFTNITSLQLYSTSEKITNFDFSSYQKLKSISIKCPNLQKIDVSNCPDLEGLGVSGKLQSLDVSKNTKLTSLSCAGNQLSELDLSNNRNIAGINCSNNKLEQLKLPQNIPPYISEIEGEGGSTITINCSYNNLKSLDLKYFKSLKYLDCSHNSISTIDWPLQTDFLRAIKCNNNDITELILASYNVLYAVDCRNNKLQNLICPTSIKYILCSNNNLTHLNLSNFWNLRTIGCWENSIEELDLSRCAINIQLVAWPMKNNSLKKIVKVKDKRIDYNAFYNYGLLGEPIEYETILEDFYLYDDFYILMVISINPADYGTTIVEID